jgi:hypothetical protein
VTTGCGHNFCHACFVKIIAAESNEAAKSCPNCRKPLDAEDGKLNGILSQILTKVFPGHGAANRR